MTIKKLKNELNNNDLIPEHRAEIEETLDKVQNTMKNAPLFKKLIDYRYYKNSINKNKIGKNGISDKSIFNFDDELMNEFLD